MPPLVPVLDLPAQLRWGSGRAGTHQPRWPSHRLLGMGGSAMAASVGALAVHADVPIVVHRGYGLPSWAPSAGALVVAVSYSGNTEEVLSGVAEAIRSGLPLAAVTSGGEVAAESERARFPLVLVPDGLQPRAALGYQVAAVLRVLGGAGAASVSLPNSTKPPPSWTSCWARVTASPFGWGAIWRPASRDAWP